MKARVTAWEVRDHCVPAIWTREEHGDGSVTYDGIYTVTMKFDVVGNEQDAHEFLNGMRVGQEIKAISFGEIKSKQNKNKPGASARKYVFE